MATRPILLKRGVHAPSRSLQSALTGRRVDRGVGLATVPSASAGRAIKRLTDVVLACLGLVLTLPLCVLICVAIVLDSPGSPIFVHRRLGRSGAEFGLLKFRTMIRRAEALRDEYLDGRPDAAQEWRCAQKVREDPRLTRVGRVLRRCSLDELPQLVNVIRGEMSLVGPRPVVRDEIERFGEHGPLILTVRPGLTGLWAVSGRNNLSYEQRVSLECRYVREWNLLLDLKILLRTIPRVLACRGAY